MPLDLRPARLDVDAIVGNDVAIVCTVTDSNAAAVNVSGYTIQADVYRAGTSVATFTDAVSGASSNIITLTLTDTQTTTLGADSASMTWSLRVTNGSDTREWIAGRFRLYTVGAAGNTTTTAVALTAGSVSVSVSAIGVAGGGAVTSVNGETGAVSLIASEIPFTPTGSIAASDLQAAVAEVATDAAAAYQPVDSDLTAVAGLTPTNDDVLQRKAGAWTNRTIAQLLTDLAAPGTTFQPLDSDLTAIAALTTTSYGRAFLALADQAALMALLAAASETAAGKVELATTAEATAQTDTARAVTPAGLADRVLTSRTISTTAPVTGGGDLSANRTIAVSAASDTATGVVELATDSEVATGTDTARAVTPAGAAATYVAKTQTLNAQTGTTYTLVLTDATKLVTLSNASAITLTVPPNSSVAFPIGSYVDLLQLGAGAVTVTPGSGVTIRATPSAVFRAQYSGASLVKIDTDTWSLVGDLT